MAICDFLIHSQTYVAGDWTGGSDAIKQLEKWNERNHWNLHYNDVHKKTQACDSSLRCSIKKYLKERMSKTKSFVLVV